MMALPFLIFTLGLLATGFGRRSTALALCLGGAVVLIILFRLHATDALNFVF